MADIHSDGALALQNIEANDLQWTRSEQSVWAKRYEQLEQWVELGQYHVRTLRQKVQNLETKNAKLREENARLRQKLKGEN